MVLSALAVALGGGLGSLLRWALGSRLNALFVPLPLGTLAANLIAAYIIGIAIAFFTRMPGLSSEWRLFVITGLLGGLSTFSTFSAEVVTHLHNEEYAWAIIQILAHLAGSLIMTMLGLLTIAWFGR